MKIKYKLLAGFFLINAILIVAGAMSIYELTRMREHSFKLIDNNYKALKTLNVMLKSVEKEDKGTLLLLLGQWKNGRTILNQADHTFQTHYEKAVALTPGKSHLPLIKEKYEAFKRKWEKPIVDTQREGNIKWYYSEFIPAFQSVVDEIETAMVISEDNMHKESKVLLENSHQAMMPGIIAIISAVLLSLLMYFFTTTFFSKPINDILKALKDFNEKGKPFSVKINTNDEIKELSKEIKKATVE